MYRATKCKHVEIYGKKFWYNFNLILYGHSVIKRYQIVAFAETTCKQ